MSQINKKKFEFSFIMPTAYINNEINDNSDFILALSHLIDDNCVNDYAKAIVERKNKHNKPIILDNGLYENHVPEQGASLLMKAHKIGADSVFAPDHLYSTEKTRQSLFEFIEEKKSIEADQNIKLPEINYVIQAYNYKDYIDEFIRAQEYDIKLIGLSILSIPKSFAAISGTRRISLNRAVAIGMLNNLPITIKKKCHMLGLGESLIDIILGKQVERIISNDSCVAFHAGMKGHTWSSTGTLIAGKPIDKLDFEQQDMDTFERNKKGILQNMHTIKNI